VHGSFHLTQGYTLAFVPRDARFKHDLASHGDSPKTHPNTTISCQYNVVKIVVALAQTVFAITTLYRSRGNQIELYGYAAFGLTVTPYAFMSFVNLLGNLMRPQYSALYLVGSPEMDDALKDGCCFDGVVGKLDISKETVKAPSRLHWIFWTWLPLVLGAIPIAIVGAISHFDSGQSTKAQRVWTMTWLVFGTVIDIVPVSQLVQKFMGIHADVFFHERITLVRMVLSHMTLILCGAPTIGGIVVVAQMLIDYGVCAQINRNH
jgi:hypothetical protein